MKFTLYICIICFLASCQIKVKEYPEPKNLISKDKLVVILEELMLVEQHIQSKYPQLNQFRKTAQLSGDAILKKNHVTSKRFDEAMDYYGSRQEEMKKIYDRVLERMNAKLNKL